jgi:hypothetical protein
MISMFKVDEVAAILEVEASTLLAMMPLLAFDIASLQRCLLQHLVILLLGLPFSRLPPYETPRIFWQLLHLHHPPNFFLESSSEEEQPVYEGEEPGWW